MCSLRYVLWKEHAVEGELPSWTDKPDIFTLVKGVKLTAGQDKRIRGVVERFTFESSWCRRCQHVIKPLQGVNYTMVWRGTR